MKKSVRAHHRFRSEHDRPASPVGTTTCWYCGKNEMHPVHECHQVSIFERKFMGSMDFEAEYPPAKPYSGTSSSGPR